MEGVNFHGKTCLVWRPKRGRRSVVAVQRKLLVLATARSERESVGCLLIPLAALQPSLESLAPLGMGAAGKLLGFSHWPGSQFGSPGQWLAMAR